MKLVNSINLYPGPDGWRGKQKSKDPDSNQSSSAIVQRAERTRFHRVHNHQIPIQTDNI